MPVIQEYTSKTAEQGLRPTETGIEATAQAARRIGTAYRETGSELGNAISTVGTQAGGYWEHREISKGAAEFSDFMAKATDEWNTVATNADPHDPNLAVTFRDKLNERLEDFRNSFSTKGGRDWAEHSIDQFRNHMVQKTTADMGSLAGKAAEVDIRQTQNSLTTMARKDPTSLDAAMDMGLKSVDQIIASSPNLKGTEAGKARAELTQKMGEEIVKAHYLGKADLNPDAAMRELDNAANSPYAKFTNSQEITQIVKYAQQQKRLADGEARQAIQFQKQQDTDKANGFVMKSILSTIQPDGTIKITPDFNKGLRQNLEGLSHASPGILESALRFGETAHDKNNQTDPAVFRGLSERLFGDEDLNVVARDALKARVAGKLSDHDSGQFLTNVKELQEMPLRDPVFKTTMEAVKDRLMLKDVPGMPGKDVDGEMKVAQFTQAFLPKYLAQMRAGTLPPNALDVNDPKSLISQEMEPYKRTWQQRFQSYTSSIQGLSAAAGLPTPGSELSTVPQNLRGIEGLTPNKGRTQFFDPNTGKLYDKQGNEISRKSE